MARTPAYLKQALEMVTAPQIAVAEALAPVERRHVERVRSIFEDPNIVGAGIAEKIIDGKRTDTLSLVFYVREKLPKAKLDPENLLPPVVAGRNGRAVFTDVSEIGDVVPQVAALAEPNARPRPIASGFSIGHVDTTAGTLGALVKKGRKTFALSNSHVLAQSGLAKPGDIVVYPGPADDGTADTDKIATLAAFTPFTGTLEFLNEADAALAELLADHVADIDPNIPGAKLPLRVASPERGMVVIKRGRTSGDTESVVRDTDFSTQVVYDGVGRIGFTRQVLCDTYTMGGDSGALVIAKESGAIVGLHFAGSPKGSVFTPIQTVMAALKFRF